MSVVHWTKKKKKKKKKNTAQSQKDKPWTWAGYNTNTDNKWSAEIADKVSSRRRQFIQKEGRTVQMLRKKCNVFCEQKGSKRVHASSPNWKQSGECSCGEGIRKIVQAQ
jgi:hypothetical protein